MHDSVTLTLRCFVIWCLVMWWLHSILQAPPTTFSVGFSCPINRKTNGELAMAFSLHATLPHANPVPPYFPKLRDQILTRRLRFSSCRKAHACFILLGRKVRLIATGLALPPLQTPTPGILSWAWLCEQSYKHGSGNFEPIGSGVISHCSRCSKLD